MANVARIAPSSHHIEKVINGYSLMPWEIEGKVLWEHLREIEQFK
jgi:hypothetical protein